MRGPASDGCGEPVAGAPEPLPEESRKVVSIVFADLVGSTALQEKLDPESVRHVMSPLLRHDAIGSLERFRELAV